MGTPFVEMSNVDGAAAACIVTFYRRYRPLMRGGQSVQETFRWNPRGEKFDFFVVQFGKNPGLDVSDRLLEVR